jgi:hypothetical protein
MIFITLGLLGGFSRFGPYSSSRFLASSSVRPWSASLDNASRTLLDAVL